MLNRELLCKVREAVFSVLPITLIVLLLNFTIIPMSSGTIKLFLTGTFMLILGMGLFTLGADMSMMLMGEKIGAYLTKSKNLILVIVSCFFIGVIITLAEPDLQVLAQQVPNIPNMIIILAVALGVGIFLVIAVLRILFKVKLNYILTFFYIAIFILMFFIEKDFLPVAFDSGGVTTGPITVPFIIALGIGIASVCGDKSVEENSFGLVALCSIGPIIAVLFTGNFYDFSQEAYSINTIQNVDNLFDIYNLLKGSLPSYSLEVAGALLPILLLFLIFQIFAFKISKKGLIKITIGILYTYLGLVLFITGVNVGFMPVGIYVGKNIALLSYNWILVPLGMIIGYFIVMAEPAVYLLNKQVEDISEGAISRKMMQRSLSIGVAISLGLAMFRVLTGISIWYLIVPGYSIAIILSFFVPEMFTAIAFDSGGVASGPMTATFLLPIAMGACDAIGGNILTDAFGIIAMVAMTPLISIQILGLIYNIKIKKSKKIIDRNVSKEEYEIINYDEEK